MRLRTVPKVYGSLASGHDASVSDTRDDVDRGYALVPELPLLERHLGEASELARMESIAFLRPHSLERVEPDIEMLPDALAIKFARHARELDLTVHRLIRDTQQCAVWDAEAKAIRGDRG